MNIRQLSSLAVLGSLVVGAFAQSAPTIDVLPSLAPNGYGSPNFDPYVGNAMNALENGLSAIGNPATDPDAYFQVSTMPLAWNMVTSFNSWRGLANPGTNFGAAFAGEYGNRLHFGLHIVSEGYGNRFALDSLTFDMNSSDPGNELDFDGDFIGYAYTPRRIGIDYGADGLKGTSDDLMYNNNEAGTNLVNELMYVGVGNAWWPDDLNNNQSTIDAEVARVRGLGMPNLVTTTYGITVNGNPFSNGATVTLVPEPASLSILGLGLFAFLRKRAK